MFGSWPLSTGNRFPRWNRWKARRSPDDCLVDTALEYARQIAEAPEYAHECGVIDRERQGTAEWRVKLLDFGLGKGGRGPQMCRIIQQLAHAN